MNFFYKLLVISFLFINGCVSIRTFSDIENRYANEKLNYKLSQEENKNLKYKIDSLSQNLISRIKLLNESNDSIRIKNADLLKLKKNYDLLASRSNSDLKQRINENNSLLDSLTLKQYELNKGLARVNELERLVLEKEQNLNFLKKRVSDALLNFQGKGLTVEQRNGKVYVSMENKLLFKSGSWTVGPDGKKAIEQLANVLAENPEINVLIEGHTDNVPYKGNGEIKNNWDLSTKRATSIVNLLLNSNDVLPQNLTAAGRGEFIPVGSNSNEMGKSANRRIEIILTPQLGAISDLLENLNY